MLTLSTAHITPETDTLLEGEAESNSNIHLPVCHKKGEYGYFIYVSPKITPEKDEGYKAAPEDLLACMKLAYDKHCVWLCLDRDGPIEDVLPTYEW